MRIEIQGIFGPPSQNMFRVYPFFGPHENGYRTFGMPRNRLLTSENLEQINLDRKVLLILPIQIEIESPQLLWMGKNFCQTSEGVGVGVPKLSRSSPEGTFLVCEEAQASMLISEYLRKLARWMVLKGSGSIVQVGAELALHCAPTHPLTEWMGWFSQTSKEGRAWEIQKTVRNRWEISAVSSSEVEEEFRKVEEEFRKGDPYWGPA